MHHLVHYLPWVPVVQFGREVFEKGENSFVEANRQMHGAPIGTDEEVAERQRGNELREVLRRHGNEAVAAHGLDELRSGFVVTGVMRIVGFAG